MSVLRLRTDYDNNDDHNCANYHNYDHDHYVDYYDPDNNNDYYFDYFYLYLGSYSKPV